VDAMREVAAYKPDIILLQESPTAQEVDRFAQSVYPGEAGVWPGADASLIVHGRIDRATLPRSLSSFFVQARATLTNGMTLEVVSTRLMPAVFREDIWSPDCWQAHAQNRRLRREQMRSLSIKIGEVPSNIPILLAGDFNAPQNDAIFELLRPRLWDAFQLAGSGWGNTITNEMPVLRIDQVWSSGSLVPVAAVAHRTRESDHRMVIVDFVLKN